MRCAFSTGYVAESMAVLPNVEDSGVRAVSVQLYVGSTSRERGGHVTTATTIDEPDQPYETLTRAQMRALIDRRARRQFGMSIDEFEAALERGDFADEPQATALAILLHEA